MRRDTSRAGAATTRCLRDSVDGFEWGDGKMHGFPKNKYTTRHYFYFFFRNKSKANANAKVRNHIPPFATSLTSCQTFLWITSQRNREFVGVKNLMNFVFKWKQLCVNWTGGYPWFMNWTIIGEDMTKWSNLLKYMCLNGKCRQMALLGGAFSHF